MHPCARAPSWSQCARKIKCHLVFRRSDYLFFCPFPSPQVREPSCCHLDRMLKNPSAFFHVLLLSPFSFVMQVSSAMGFWLQLMLVVFVLCQIAFVAILCHCHALRLILDSCSCLNACYPSKVIALSVVFICYSGLLNRYMFNMHLSLVVI